jgi:hypothetical protein
MLIRSNRSVLCAPSVRAARRTPLRLLPRLAALCAAILLAASCTGSQPAAEPVEPTTTPGAASARAATQSPTPEPDPPPEKGECRGVSIEQLQTIVNAEPAVPCSRAHTVVTFHVSRLPQEATRDAIAPADEEVEAAADQTCRERFRDYVGGNATDGRLTMLTPTYFLPPSEQWNFGARWVRCDVYAYATPDRLADLPPTLKNALERDRVRDDFARCSPVSPSSRRFRHVICQERHGWRAVATRPVGGEKERYPGARTLQDRARDKCEGAVREYLGTDEAFSYGFEVPERDAWAEGDRIALCWAQTRE